MAHREKPNKRYPEDRDGSLIQTISSEDCSAGVRLGVRSSLRAVPIRIIDEGRR